VVQHYTLAAATGSVTYDWRSIWLFSAIVSTLVLLFFLFTFSEKETRLAASGFPAEAELGSSSLPQ
jgi:hypothetical protein